MSDADRMRWDERYAARAPSPGVVPGPPECFAAVADEFPTGGRGLEIACGTGVFAVWLALRGIEVTAVDVDDDGTTTQSVFAGNFTVKAKVTKGTPIIAVKPNSAAPEESAGAAEQTPVELTVSDGQESAKHQVTVDVPKDQGGMGCSSTGSSGQGSMVSMLLLGAGLLFSRRRSFGRG